MKLFGVLAAFTLTAGATAQDGWYASLSGLAQSLDDEDIALHEGDLNLDLSFDTGLGLRSAIGYQLELMGDAAAEPDNDNLFLQIEAELGWTGTDVESVNVTYSDYDYGKSTKSENIDLTGDVTSMALMVNFRLVYVLQPVGIGFYGFFGVGISHNSLNAGIADAPFLDLTMSGTNFSWTSGLGVQYEITPQVDLYGGWRYTDFGHVEASNIEVDLAGSAFEMGVRLHF